MAETAGRTIRLAVQSRRRLMRDTLSAYLAGRPEFRVVGQTGSLDSLYALCALRRPDVVLVDAGPLTVDLVQSLHGLRTAFPDTDLVVAYTELTPYALDAAIQHGLTGLISSARGLDAVVRMLRHRAGPVSRAPDGLALTDRELEIISLLGAGHSVPEMAELLRISPRTVENHKRHLYAKLGVGTQSHAVSRATSLGLLETMPDVEPAQRPHPEDGREPLVVVSGPPGPALDEVTVALLATGIPTVHAHRRPPLGREHWARWHRGPILAALVDPSSEDWLLAGSLGAPAVVVHTAEPDLAGVLDGLLRGAYAVLRTDQVRDDLTMMLTLIGRGYFAMNADRIGELIDWMCVRLADRPAGVPELTARERDILASIADGHTVRQTARTLGIATKTVENTQARLFRKLGARNRAGVLTIAYRLGLIDPAGSAGTGGDNRGESGPEHS
jgi:two-component system, NarL family, nitrate/nitrite response regulator NarL